MKAQRLTWREATAFLGMGAAVLLASAFWTQQASADDGAPGTAATSKASPKPERTDQPAKTNEEATAKPAPAAAPAQPVPPEKSGGDPHIKPGSDYPLWEAFLGYSYLNGRVGSGISTYNGNGGSGSIAYNLNRWVGLVGDLGGYHTGTIANVGVDLNQFTYLFGPRLNYRFGQNERHNLFGQILLGGDHANGSIQGSSGSDNAFAMAVGGGLDAGITKHIAWRVGQLEYLMTRFNIPAYNTQNDLRFSTGILFRWGAKPLAVNRPPTASCSASPSSVVQGSGSPVAVTANASDPDGDPLTYSWSSNDGQVEGSGPTVRWNPGNARPGTYSITARVDDGHGGTASCSANVTVEPRPLRPPTVSCSVDRNSVLPGEVVNVTASGSSSEGFPLDYSWRASGGRVSGSGSRVQFDTSGLAPGDYSVTARATDGHGGAADCSAGVHVSAPPAKPQASKVGECIFKPGSTRVDNKCSRLLDDAVVRLQNDPKSTLVLIGYADPDKEKKGKIAETRAANAKKYATQGKGKGTARVDAGRVNNRAEAGVKGADTANRRVEIFWVPEGANL